MTIEQAISEAVAIKHQIDELKSRYTDLQAEIISGVQIPDGKRTGYVDSGNVRARVQIMEKYKWDQDKLNAAPRSDGRRSIPQGLHLRVEACGQEDHRHLPE